MLEHLFRDESALARHQAGPFAEERERCLQHCAEHGATRGALRMKANELLWLCQHLRSDASQGIDMPALQELARERGSVRKGASTEQRLVNIGRPWLRFLGWWRVPPDEARFQSQLERYVTWMRNGAWIQRVNRRSVAIERSRFPAMVRAHRSTIMRTRAE